MSAPYFNCGTRNIEAGVVEFTVTGLALPYDTPIVAVSVRQPDFDADVITATVAGTPTSDGFKVVLSSPAGEGYKLDWQAMSGAGGGTDTGASIIGYTELKKCVARFLGYDETNLSARQMDEVDTYIQSGVRNYYYPPKTEGVDETFEWEFLKRSGTITTTANEAVYLMEDGFGRIAGCFHYPLEDDCRGVSVVPYGEILRRDSTRTGRPVMAAVYSKNAYGTKGQRKEVAFWPKPDKAYQLSFRYDADAGKLDESSRPFPMGGAMYSELVRESCLAAAELGANDEAGVHEAKRRELIAGMIGRGRKEGAQNYGFIGIDTARALPGW